MRRSNTRDGALAEGEQAVTNTAQEHDRLIVDTAASIEAIPENDWDALLDDSDLYTTHAWLRALEQVSGPTQTLLARVAGRLGGGLPLWRPPPNADGLFQLPSYFPEVPGP